MLRYLFFGICCYLVFLITTLPANVVYGYWKQYLGKEVPLVMDGVNGSIWSGSAAQLGVAGQQMQKFNWQFKPGRLFLGNTELEVEFSMQEGYGRGRVGYNLLGSLYLNNWEAWLPMGQVLPLFNLGSLNAGGFLAVNLTNLVLKEPTITTATGSIAWQDAEITILKPMAIGSLQVELQPTAEGVKGVVSDMGGPLQAEGLLNIDHDGKYDFVAEVAVRDAQQQDLANAIRSMGRADKNGKVKISQSGDMSRLGLF